MAGWESIDPAWESKGSKGWESIDPAWETSSRRGRRGRGSPEPEEPDDTSSDTPKNQTPKVHIDKTINRGPDGQTRTTTTQTIRAPVGDLPRLPTGTGYSGDSAIDNTGFGSNSGQGIIGYAGGGLVKPRAPDDDDDVYSSTAPAWTKDSYAAALGLADDQSQGYAQGGPVTRVGYANGGDVEDGSPDPDQLERERIAREQELEAATQPADTGYTERQRPSLTLRDVMDYGRNLFGISQAHAADVPVPGGPTADDRPPVEHDPLHGTVSALRNLFKPREPDRGDYPAQDPGAPIRLSSDQQPAASPDDSLLGLGLQAVKKPFQDMARQDELAGALHGPNRLVNRWDEMKGRLADYLNGGRAMTDEQMTQRIEATAKSSPQLDHSEHIRKTFEATLQREGVDAAHQFVQGLRTPVERARALGIAALEHGAVTDGLKFIEHSHNIVPTDTTLHLIDNNNGTFTAVVRPHGVGQTQTYNLTGRQLYDFAAGPASQFDHIADNGTGKNLDILTKPRQPDNAPNAATDAGRGGPRGQGEQPPPANEGGVRGAASPRPADYDVLPSSKDKYGRSRAQQIEDNRARTGVYDITPADKRAPTRTGYSPEIEAQVRAAYRPGGVGYSPAEIEAQLRSGARAPDGTPVARPTPTVDGQVRDLMNPRSPDEQRQGPGTGYGSSALSPTDIPFHARREQFAGRLAPYEQNALEAERQQKAARQAAEAKVIGQRALDEQQQGGPTPDVMAERVARLGPAPPAGPRLLSSSLTGKLGDQIALERERQKVKETPEQRQARELAREGVRQQGGLAREDMRQTGASDRTQARGDAAMDRTQYTQGQLNQRSANVLAQRDRHENFLNDRHTQDLLQRQGSTELKERMATFREKLRTGERPNDAELEGYQQLIGAAARQGLRVPDVGKPAPFDAERDGRRSWSLDPIRQSGPQPPATAQEPSVREYPGYQTVFKPDGSVGYVKLGQ